MSVDMEERAKYISQSLENYINAGCFASYQAWEPPTAGELRYMLDKAGLGQTELAKIIGVDARTVRRWVGGDVQITYLAWCVICSYCGIKELWSY